MQAVRIWVHDQSAWRLLAAQETTLSEIATPPKNDATECENPCKTIPYSPKNDSEKDIIASWQALETAVTHHDAKVWASHIADEFVIINNNNDHVFTKHDRMAVLDKQRGKEAPVRAGTAGFGADVRLQRCGRHEGRTSAIIRVRQSM